MKRKSNLLILKLLTSVALLSPISCLSGVDGASNLGVNISTYDDGVLYIFGNNLQNPPKKLLPEVFFVAEISEHLVLLNSDEQLAIDQVEFDEIRSNQKTLEKALKFDSADKATFDIELYQLQFDVFIESYEEICDVKVHYSINDMQSIALYGKAIQRKDFCDSLAIFSVRNDFLINHVNIGEIELQPVGSKK